MDRPGRRRRACHRVAASVMPASLSAKFAQDAGCLLELYADIPTLRPMLRAVAVACVLFVPTASMAVETMRIHMGDADDAVLVGTGLGFGLDQEDGTYSSSPGGRTSVRVV